MMMTMNESYNNNNKNTNPAEVRIVGDNSKRRIKASKKARGNKRAFSVSPTEEKTIVKAFKYTPVNWRAVWNQPLTTDNGRLHYSSIDAVGDLSEPRWASAENTTTETLPPTDSLPPPETDTPLRGQEENPHIRTKSKWLKTDISTLSVYNAPDSETHFYNTVIEKAGDHLWIKSYDKVMDKGTFLAGLLKGHKATEYLYDADGNIITNKYGVPKCGCVRCVPKDVVPRTAEQKRKDNTVRAKKRAIKIITANYPRFTYSRMAPALITLTYARKYTEYAQASNYRETLDDLRVFLRHLRKLQPRLAYIWAPELQEGEDGNGRMCVHFHILCFNLRYITQEELIDLNKAWKKGFDEYCSQGGTDIKRFVPGKKDERRAMFYVAKYITKSGEWLPPELNLYGISRGLILPKLYWMPQETQALIDEFKTKPNMVAWINPRPRYDKWRNVTITDLKVEPDVPLAAPSTAKPAKAGVPKSLHHTNYLE